MSIVNRAKNILMSPTTEWEVVASENATPAGLITSYAAPLAAIAAVSGIVGAIVIGSVLMGVMGGGAGGAAIAGITTVSAIITGLVSFVLGLGLVFAMGFIVSALAPSFGGQSDTVQGAKLIVYSGTPVWVAGFLAIIPGIGTLAGLAGLVYACYLIAIGLRPVLGIPQDKTAGMTVVTILIYFIGALVVAGINFAIGAVGTVASTAAVGM